MVEEAKEEGFPVDVEEKEAYFMNEVARGEQLAQDGMISTHQLALAACRRKDPDTTDEAGSSLSSNIQSPLLIRYNL